MSQRTGVIDHWVKMPPKQDSLSLSFPDPYKSQHVTLSICHPSSPAGRQEGEAEAEDSLDAYRLASLAHVLLCFRKTHLTCPCVCMPVHACACLCMCVHACPCMCMPVHTCACLSMRVHIARSCHLFPFVSPYLSSLRCAHRLHEGGSYNTALTCYVSPISCSGLIHGLISKPCSSGQEPLSKSCPS